MKINQKILNLIIILSMVLSTIFFTKTDCFAFVNDASGAKTNVVTTVDKNSNHFNVKQKDEKNDFKDILIKFFMSMLGVLLSSVAIILGLKLYKKLILKNNSKLNNIDYDKTFDTPKDFKEAINLFLDKTNK